MPARRLSRFSNRTIIGTGLVLCIAVAVAAAYLLGWLDRAGALP
jgi:hypothetical protein